MRIPLTSRASPLQSEVIFDKLYAKRKSTMSEYTQIRRQMRRRREAHDRDGSSTFCEWVLTAVRTMRLNSDMERIQLAEIVTAW